jgi:hypothetical protein
MLDRISRHIRANVVGYLALFVALSGTALASGVLNKKKVNKIISNRAPVLTVGNANALGGTPASAFVRGPAEAPREVGSSGNPGFASCATGHNWQNNPSGFGNADFYRDPGGVVHISGAVDCAVAPTSATIFTLPPGYTPAVMTGFFPTIDQFETVRGTNVTSDGQVKVGQFPAATAILFLEGVSFRCGPSGANGCP